jgi:hypothetical protein
MLWDVKGLNLIYGYVFPFFLGSCYSAMDLLLLRSPIYYLHDDWCRLQSAGEAQNEPFEYQAETEVPF